MDRPELLLKDTARSPAELVDEMSRLYYLSRALHVVAELGVADLLDDEPVGVESLASSVSADPLALHRLLRFLTAYGLFEEAAPGRFRNTALSEALRDDQPGAARANLRRIGVFWWQAIRALEHTIRTGESAFEHVHGVPFFRYLRDNPEVQQRFDAAMAGISDADDAAIAASYDFARFRRIVDVGGGRGGLLVQILLRAPEATGVLYEQPQVVARATRLAEAGLSDRVDLVAGDFFASVPEGGDCYVIKGVLHDFSDAECAQLLANCRDAMTVDGRLVIANRDVPDRVGGPHPNLTMDIQMMTLLTGRERTEADWRELLGGAGFAIGQRAQTDVDFILIEGVPA